MKHREESVELEVWRSLHARMNLSIKETNHYTYLEKGYKGELEFDEWIAALPNDRLILNDLLLEYNRTVFQIDSLLIASSNTVEFFEVKNYEGDYFFEGDKWYSSSKAEIKNPLLQLNRTASLLRQTLQELGFNFNVEPHLIFINPEFHLYHAPSNLPIIFPAQLNRFMDSLKRRPFKLKDLHTKLAEKFLALHLTENPYNRLPSYQYDELKKGIICPSCQSFCTPCTKMTLICKVCGKKENNDTAVLRAV